jgi:translation elongation factor aEF-1 beta
MANVVITLRIMPQSPDTDLNKIEMQAKQKIQAYAGKGDTKTTITPIAFGLKSVDIIFIMDEKKGATDPLEKQISEIDGVNSVEVTDVRRAVG